MNIKIDRDDSKVPFRFSSKEGNRPLELIKISVTTDGIGVYQKGLSMDLFEACKFAVSVVTERGVPIYLIYDNRNILYLVEARSSPFDVEKFLKRK